MSTAIIVTVIIVILLIIGIIIGVVVYKKHSAAAAASSDPWVGSWKDTSNPSNSTAIVYNKQYYITIGGTIYPAYINGTSILGCFGSTIKGTLSGTTITWANKNTWTKL